MPKISSFAHTVIYVYTIPDESHRGMMKIGQTHIEATSPDELSPNCQALHDAATKRINEQATTIAVDYDLRYVELAHFMKDGVQYNISDTEVHNILINSGYQRVIFPNLSVTPKEWFYVDNLDIVKKAISAAKDDKISLDLSDHKKPDNKEKIVINFRDEQTAAIEQTLIQFNIGSKMLWNAKMRFGKTLCALEVIKRKNYRRTLIITHRPSVRNGWFDDFNLLDFGDNYFFGMGDRFRKAIAKNDPLASKIKNFNDLEQKAANGEVNYIYFASLQDLRGSKRVGGKHYKNDDLFDTPWDLLIIDEAHEGTMAEHGKPVIDELQKNETLHTLYLSGTPYNIMKDFSKEEVYTWDYVMEQEAKERWNIEHPEEPNPYDRLPRLEMHRYNLSDEFGDYGRDEDDYFNFAEFFRIGDGQNNTIEGRFVHEEDVKRFLRLLCKEDSKTGYPYSTPEFRYALSHTLWVLPSVAAANEMERLISASDSPLNEYFVINVAGDNVDNQDNPDAVTKVAEGINNHDKTITLTINSGRMTVGVSVPEWSGVFMLSGAAKAQASSYLQTIFRAQTPSRRGVYPFKTVCHAFDFAPDRVLEIVNEMVEQHARANRPPLTHRQAVEQTLRFVAVIAHDMSREEPLDTVEFMGMVGRAYSDHIIRRGFADKRLFINLDQLTPEQYNVIGNLGLKMQKSGHQFSSADTSGAAVTLANAGLDPKPTKSKGGKGSKEGSKNPPKSKSKPKKKDNPGEQALKILKEIYTRLPMLIFGCDINDNDITIQHLIDNIDAESWAVFMPKGIGQKEMQQLIDMHIVQEDRFVSAAMQVRDATRQADSLPVTERVKTIASQIANFRFPDKETVLTPWNIVNMHLSDTIGGWDFYEDDHKTPASEPRFIDQPGITTTVYKPESRILEINSKSGLYPLYATYSMFRWRKEHPLIGDPEDDREIWKIVVASNIYVLCMSEMAAKITRRVLLGYDNDSKSNIQPYLKNRDIVKDLKTDPESVMRRLRGSNNFWHNNKNNMTFDTIIGNPPYQLMDGGAGVSATPIYNRFVDLAKMLTPDNITMIMPAKWYTDGKGLGSFRETMLKDRQILKLVDFTDSRDCFEKVDIAGGVCYFLWKKGHDGMCNFTSVHRGQKNTIQRILGEGDGFLRHIEAETIIAKIKHFTQEFYQSRVSTQKPFGLRTYVTPLESGDITLRYNKGVGPYDSSLVTTGNSMITQWKVIISCLTAEHAGQTDKEGRKKILSSLDTLAPNEICTETYLVVDSFDSEAEAKALVSYLKTKFVRFLIAQLAATQHISKEKFAYVPVLDFTTPIEGTDWTASIEDIDKALYAKYDLTDDEVDFINKMIKPIQ
ncbi:MAG: Eco57I restriction-modification methylase domain-containing protein [Muribaculum sp.]|nr:Eco57I restriction-modification methylase domain-containing protein [Muribaculum sp.]